MEHQLWKFIVETLTAIDKPRTQHTFAFSDEEIVRVYFWAVIHDRPIMWACCRSHWPIHLRRRPLPSNTTMSRRLRTPSVVALLTALEQRISRSSHVGVFWMIDGKPLPIGGCSKDPDAKYGRSAGGYARGYKLHTLLNSTGKIAAWQVQPMNIDERAVAEQLLASTEALAGYVVADANYDSNKLHRVCDSRGAQLVTPRRYGPARGMGHRPQTPGRLRSIALNESPFPEFAQQLHIDRRAIERRFGNLTNWGGGLSCLPAWVRRISRVRRWVQAKLILDACKRRIMTTTYAA